MGDGDEGRKRRGRRRGDQASAPATPAPDTDARRLLEAVDTLGGMRDLIVTSRKSTAEVVSVVRQGTDLAAQVEAALVDAAAALTHLGRLGSAGQDLAGFTGSLASLTELTLFNSDLDAAARASDGEGPGQGAVGGVDDGVAFPPHRQPSVPDDLRSLAADTARTASALVGQIHDITGHTQAVADAIERAVAALRTLSAQQTDLAARISTGSGLFDQLGRLVEVLSDALSPLGVRGVGADGPVPSRPLGGVQGRG